MPILSAFMTVSLDGYFSSPNGDMSWAHRGPPDDEWSAFVAGNAEGGGRLLFGRVTYEMMAKWWPSPQAAAMDPVVARRMNEMPKFVVSRTLSAATWQNTTLLKGDLATSIRELKAAPGDPITILGSGSLLAQLARAELIDAYQIVVAPLVLGEGRSIFAGPTARIGLRLQGARAFRNGNVLLNYEREG